MGKGDKRGYVPNQDSGQGQADLDRLGGPRVQGIVKRLVQDKGFGFIRTEDGIEYFFHQSGVTGATGFNELVEGDRVEFVAGKGPKGPRAESIRIAPIT